MLDGKLCTSKGIPKYAVDLSDVQVAILTGTHGPDLERSATLADRGGKHSLRSEKHYYDKALQYNAEQHDKSEIPGHPLWQSRAKDARALRVLQLGQKPA